MQANYSFCLSTSLNINVLRHVMLLNSKLVVWLFFDHLKVSKVVYNRILLGSVKHTLGNVCHAENSAESL